MTETLNDVGKLVVEQSAADALQLPVEAVRQMSLREFIDRATERGLDVEVSMRASGFREGRLTVEYKPDRRARLDRLLDGHDPAKNHGEVKW